MFSFAFIVYINAWKEYVYSVIVSLCQRSSVSDHDSPLKETRHRGNSKEQDEAAARYLQKGVSELLSSMETTMNKVCSFRRRLLGRTLNAELVCIIVFL